MGIERQQGTVYQLSLLEGRKETVRHRIFENVGHCVPGRLPDVDPPADDAQAAPLKSDI